MHVYHKVVLVVVSIVVCTAAHAQNINTSADPKQDAVNFINNTLLTFNNGIVRFQSVRLGLADMHPFDADRLDTAQLFQNITSLTKYEQFFSGFRQKTTGTIRRVTDSVGLLEARLGDSTHWKALDRFFQNFREETRIYVQYSLKLSKQSMEIRSALILLQLKGFDIIGSRVKIRGGREVEEEYETHINKMKVAAQEADDAFQTVIAETAKSNKIVLEILETLSK